MLFQYAVRAFGLSARPLVDLSAATAAPRFLNAALYPRLQPTRCSSWQSSATAPSSLSSPESSASSASSTPSPPSSPESSGPPPAPDACSSSSPSPPSPPPLPATLTPPWQVSDLSAGEQAAYHAHGPAYLARLGARAQAAARRAVRARAGCARAARQQLGPAWYAILKEADRRLAPELAPARAELRRREGLLGPVVDGTKPPLTHRRFREDRRAWLDEVARRKRQLQLQIKEELSGKGA